MTTPINLKAPRGRLLCLYFAREPDGGLNTWTLVQSMEFTPGPEPTPWPSPTATASPAPAVVTPTATPSAVVATPTPKPVVKPKP